MFGEKCIVVESDRTLGPAQANGRHWMRVRKADAVIDLPQPRASNQSGALAIANESDGPVIVKCDRRFVGSNDQFVLASQKIAMLWAIKEAENCFWYGATLDGLTGLEKEKTVAPETDGVNAEAPPEKKAKRVRTHK